MNKTMTQEKNQGLAAVWADGDFSVFEPPQIDFQPSRWSTIRTENVEGIGAKWDEKCSRALVFKDPKLKGKELVLMSKALLDSLLTPFRELIRGRAAIRLDVNIVASNVTALKHALNVIRNCNERDDGQSSTETEMIQAALANVEALEMTISRISASIIMSNPKDTEISSMTDEERALADELLQEEDE